MARVLERRRAVALARHYREFEGLSIRQIADRLGRSPATVKAYFYDPTGEKARAVKARYQGVRRDCRACTQARNGKGDADAYCKACHPGAIERRWTRERVVWHGRLLSSYDWSRTARVGAGERRSSGWGADIGRRRAGYPCWRTSRCGRAPNTGWYARRLRCARRRRDATPTGVTPLPGEPRAGVLRCTSCEAAGARGWPVTRFRESAPAPLLVDRLSLAARGCWWRGRQSQLRRRLRRCRPGAPRGTRR
jgi:AcrR family transcriptional regulator